MGLGVKGLSKISRHHTLKKKKKKKKNEAMSIKREKKTRENVFPLGPLACGILGYQTKHWKLQGQSTLIL